MLALQLAVHAGHIRLLDPPMAALAARAGVERGFQRRIVHGLRQRPGEARGLRRFKVSRTVERAIPSRRAISCADTQEDFSRKSF